jgi:ribonucleoside-diphosphate reductase beta chain|tara:strand:- start:18266 stop:19546 length:1281 start_codon:yes stop_codon:yes gene_type:complete
MDNLIDSVTKDIRYVIKRSGDKVVFKSEKIEIAILNAMKSIDKVDENMAEKIARLTTKGLFRGNKERVPNVDEIHDMVENKLMDNGLNYVAKEYIIYRSKNQPNIFSKRINLKPYEYPNLNEYVDAIRHSYWVHTEFNYTSDIQDYKVHLNDKEKSAVERAMLAISQIEVAVKSFWGDIYKRMPKPEIGNVGATFAESEVRHADAYSHLIQLLGLNNEFENLLEVPQVRRRIKYLEKAISNSKSVDDKEYFESIVLFSMFVENVSLFSQFLVIMSFNKHKNKLKGISNAVEATSKEENIHAEFGFELVNLIKKENPEWWTPQLVEDLIIATKEAYEAETEVVNWIFEKGDLDFLTKKQTMEFIKHRFNVSLNSIDVDSIFEINDTLLETTEWFDDEILTTKHTDFFNKRSINYSKKQKSITSNDLF